MKIMMVGGGTLGPVTPLLAVAEAWLEEEPAEVLWVGTPNGPEREVIDRNGYTFFSLPVARFPRYLSKEWLLLPVRLIRACVQARRLLSTHEPNVICSAGGFTAVPIILANALRFQPVPVWVHQQDAKPLLTNRLTAPFATWVTTAWPETVGYFNAKRTEVIGNPVSASFLSMRKQEGVHYFELDPTKPTILVTGGGTGATWINEQFSQIRDDVAGLANVIHLTGAGKNADRPSASGIIVREHLNRREMALAMAAADLVISRAGMGALTELAAMQKAALLIPLPHSPQEMNARQVEDGAMVLFQESTTAEQLKESVRALLEDEARRTKLGAQLHERLKTDVADTIVQRLRKMVV